MVLASYSIGDVVKDIKDGDLELLDFVHPPIIKHCPKFLSLTGLGRLIGNFKDIKSTGKFSEFFNPQTNVYYYISEASRAIHRYGYGGYQQSVFVLNQLLGLRKKPLLLSSLTRPYETYSDDSEDYDLSPSPSTELYSLDDQFANSVYDYICLKGSQ